MKKFSLLVVSLLCTTWLYSQSKVSSTGGENSPVYYYEQGSRRDACSQVISSNQFENGYLSSGDQMGAFDIAVPAGQKFTLNRLVLNFFSSSDMTSVKLSYHANNDGAPGDLISGPITVTPSSDTVIGENYGFSIHQVVLDVDPYEFMGEEGQAKTYWIAVNSTNQVGDTNHYLEVTSAGPANETPSWYFDNSLWEAMSSAEGRPYEFIYDVSGDCAPLTTECNEPTGVVITRIAEGTAEFTSADDTNARYQGSANLHGRPLRPRPMYGMDDMMVGHTQAVIPVFEYDIWFRTICENGEFSEWVGPYYLPLYTAIEPTLTPNPTQGAVRIGNVMSEIKSVEVFDINGMYLMSIKPNTLNVFNLSKLPTGKYNVKITDAEGNITLKKVIKK